MLLCCIPDKADNLRVRLRSAGICLTDDSGWVVGFGIEVKRLVVRFSVWSVRQVECDIEVIN